MTPARSKQSAITETTELGIAMLIAESEDGAYQPVAPVSTISEARDMVDGDLRLRMADAERGGDPFYPARYRVWARGDHGAFASVAEIETN